MLPLEGIFFFPSLFIAPVVAGVLVLLRRRAGYPRVWRFAVIACVVLTAGFTLLTLGAPLYSERSHSPDNPGGFSVGLWAVLAELIFWTCVVIPAFPVLVVLGYLPPHGRRRWPSLAAVLLYIAVLGGLLAWKNARFWDDFERAKGWGASGSRWPSSGGAAGGSAVGISERLVAVRKMADADGGTCDFL